MKRTDTPQIFTPNSSQVTRAMQQKAIINYGQINVDNSINKDSYEANSNNTDWMLQTIEHQHKEIMQQIDTIDRLMVIIDRLQEKVFALK